MRAILPGGCGYFYPAQISAGVCLYLVFDHAQISPSPGGAVPLFGGLARGGSSNSAVFCKQGGPRSKKLNTPRNGFIAWVPDIPDIFCIPCWCSVIHTAIFLWNRHVKLSAGKFYVFSAYNIRTPHKAKIRPDLGRSRIKEYRESLKKKVAQIEGFSVIRKYIFN